MPISLYDVTVPTYLQILGAVARLLDKAEAHCAEKEHAIGDYVGCRLIEDMAPFSYQVMSTVAHSVGALEATAKGVFSPDLTPPPDNMPALKAAVAEAIAKLKAINPADVNALEGRDMAFKFKDTVMPFTAENFLMSFSMPNFYFHATTAYDILRMKGVQIGKRDFMGVPRLKMG